MSSNIKISPSLLTYQFLVFSYHFLLIKNSVKLLCRDTDISHLKILCSPNSIPWFLKNKQTNYKICGYQWTPNWKVLGTLLVESSQIQYENHSSETWRQKRRKQNSPKGQRASSLKETVNLNALPLSRLRLPILLDFTETKVCFQHSCSIFQASSFLEFPTGKIK